jgi:hypothetical protein
MEGARRSARPAIGTSGRSAHEWAVSKRLVEEVVDRHQETVVLSDAPGSSALKLLRVG